MRAPSLRRLGIIAAGWFASNLLWGLVAPGFGLAFGAVLTALVHIAQPWRSLFFVGMLLVGAPVRRIIKTGPGPSYVDAPSAGCWRLTLTWSGRSDTLDLAYVPPID
jgi:hypothetical protein